MMVNIVDAIIVVLLLFCILGGIRRGFIKETLLLCGLVIIVVISWIFRVPVATYLYKHLPFFGFKGMFRGISVLNILLYELIAFLAVFTITSLILGILLKISGLIEKILKATIILGIVSKIGGAILGFLEGYLIVYIALFILNQPFIKADYVKDALLPNIILEKTPVLSSATDNTRKAANEIYDLAVRFKNNKNNKEINEEMISVFLKYDIISEENLKYLREKGKIE